MCIGRQGRGQKSKGSHLELRHKNNSFFFLSLFFSFRQRTQDKSPNKKLPHMVKKHKYLFGFLALVQLIFLPSFHFSNVSYHIGDVQGLPNIASAPLYPLPTLQDGEFEIPYEVKKHDLLKCLLKPKRIQKKQQKKVIINPSYNYVTSYRNKDYNCREYFLLVLP